MNKIFLTLNSAVRYTSILEREINVSNWDTLGTHLGLSQDEIREIELNHQTTERRRVEMFDKWLRKEETPLWEKVTDALESMSERNLASQLKDKYVRRHYIVTTPTSCKEHSFVLKVHRNDLVARELERLKETYFLLKMSAESALETENPSPRQLERFSQDYLSGNRVVSTVEELFDSLRDFCFLDFALLENIISIFLKREEKIVSDLNDYIQQLNDFKSSTTLIEFMETIENAQKSNQGTGTCTVTLRLVGGWLEKTMEDLDKLLKEIFQDKSSVLAHIKIIRGSVIVTYLAPQSEEDCLVHLVQEKLLFVVLVGVYKLSIGQKSISLTHSDVPQFSFKFSLILAVKNNDISLLTFLLNINTCPDATDSEGWTALMRGSYSGRDKAVNLLVDANADPNIQRHDGITALYMAAQNGHSDVVDVLLRAKANPELSADDGTTPLDIARQNGHSNVISSLHNNLYTSHSEGAAKSSMAVTCADSEKIALSIIPLEAEKSTTSSVGAMTIACISSAERETHSRSANRKNRTISVHSRSIDREKSTISVEREAQVLLTEMENRSIPVERETLSHSILVKKTCTSSAVAAERQTKFSDRKTVSNIGIAMLMLASSKHWYQKHHSISEGMAAKPMNFVEASKNQVDILNKSTIRQHFRQESAQPHSVSIIIFGKFGSGKTSLSSAIAGIELDSAVTSTRRVRSQVDGGIVNIFDTAFVLTDISETTLDIAMTSISKVVIILCIDMYEELDESILKLLARIHWKYGQNFWFRAIIALTKADCYEEDKWLMLKSESETLEDKFEGDLKKWRTILREKFTATVDSVEPSCHIGMTERQFDILNIPIIPTSQLNQYALERMEQVGHGYWFDVLLIKCCQSLRSRAQHCSLQVHRDRLSQLPSYVWQGFDNPRPVFDKAEYKDQLRHQISSETKPRFEYP